MKSNRNIDVEDVKHEITRACETLYGEVNRNYYFVAKDKTERDVRLEILANLENPAYAKNVYLDMSIYIMKVDNDVFIKII